MRLITWLGVAGGRSTSERRAALRRGAWAIADQALSSLGNVLVTVLVARAVSIDEFGQFTAAFLIYLLALGACRAVAVEPLLIRFSTASASEHRHAVAHASGTALVFGAVVGTLLAIVAFALGGDLRGVLLALAAALPGLLLQDAWRFCFFAEGRPARATANDLVWIAAQAALILAVFTLDRSSSTALLAAWGAAGTIAAVFGIAQARTLPRPFWTRAWWRAQRDLSARYLGEYAVDQGSRQLALVAVGAILGLPGLAALRGAQTFMGPITMLDLAARALIVPEGAKLRQRSARAASLLFAGVALALGASALAWGAVGVLLPDQAGRALLGDTWPSAHAVLPATAVLVAANGVAAGAVGGLRVLAAATQALRIRVVTASAYLAGGICGAIVGGAPAAAAGMAISACATAPLWWLALRAELARASASPVA